jgi:hypothetical protein
MEIQVLVLRLHILILPPPKVHASFATLVLAGVAPLMRIWWNRIPLTKTNPSVALTTAAHGQFVELVVRCKFCGEAAG